MNIKIEATRSVKTEMYVNHLEVLKTLRINLLGAHDLYKIVGETIYEADIYSSDSDWDWNPMDNQDPELFNLIKAFDTIEAAFE